MRRLGALGVLCALGAAAPTARGDTPDLRVHEAAPRPRLGMRRVATGAPTTEPAQTPATAPASAPATAPASPTASPSAPAPATSTKGAKPKPKKRDEARYSPIPLDLDDLRRRVVFHFQLGYAVEQGETNQSKVPLPEGTSNTRVYTFGDAVIGTRGLVTPSLSTYFAAAFRFDQDGAPASATLPTVYDATSDGRALLIRSAYGQLDHMGPSWLQSLTVRAGRLFQYGIAVEHFDGLSLAYLTDPFEVSFFAGRRVSLYGPGSNPFLLGQSNPGTLSGGHVRLRLDHLFRVPIVLGDQWLTYDSASWSEPSLGVDISRDAAVDSSVRLHDGHVAHWRLGGRARLSDTTTVSAELDDRTDRDWRYDFVVAGASTDGDTARYLSLGIPLPRLRATVRAGTVFYDNVDVLIFGALASEHDPARSSSFSSSYVEVGAAGDLRLSGGLSVGLALTSRSGNHASADASMGLADVGQYGEDSFRQGSFSLRYTPGVRRISFETVLYARLYGEAVPFVGDSSLVYDLRGGGRFRLEGWIGERLRIVGEYEVTGTPDFATELLGLQSLRVLGEARF